MALSDLQVYSEYAYSTATEILAQQIDKFNAASQGTITLAPASHQGDYSDSIFFKKLTGLVRRRNAYGSGTVNPIVLQQLVDSSVKVAAGTPPVRIDPGQFRWIQQNPEVAGAVLGQQLAIDMMADMLNTALGATSAALKANNNTVEYIASGVGSGTLDYSAMINGAQLFGDRQQAIQAWVMHSKPASDIQLAAVNNSERLFFFETINVLRDPLGRIFVITDSPNLVNTGSPNTYNVLGLQTGAVYVGQNNDFDANESTLNGNENITRSYQAEWSYQLGLKGYSWDKTNGGHSPTDAAIFTGTNWDQTSTSVKDTAGVLVLVK